VRAIIVASIPRSPFRRTEGRMRRPRGKSGPKAGPEETTWSGREGSGRPFRLGSGDGAARRRRDKLDRRLCRRLDRPRHDIGEIALDADLCGQQPVDEALIGVDIGDHDLEQIVDAAAGRPAAYDLAGVPHRPLEALEILIAMLLEDDLDEHAGEDGDLLEGKLGAIAADEA